MDMEATIAAIVLLSNQSHDLYTQTAEYRILQSAIYYLEYSLRRYLTGKE